MWYSIQCKFAQVKLLLYFRGCQSINADGSIDKKPTFDFAFVRPYYEMERDSISKLTQCIQLSWSKPTIEGMFNIVSTSSRIQDMPLYFLIDIKHILKVIHVVSHFRDE